MRVHRGDDGILQCPNPACKCIDRWTPMIVLLGGHGTNAFVCDVCDAIVTPQEAVDWTAETLVLAYDPTTGRPKLGTRAVSVSA